MVVFMVILSQTLHLHDEEVIWCRLRLIDTFVLLVYRV